MFDWLKEIGKRIRKSLTESPEEIGIRQRKQQMTENQARAKANERLTIQAGQEKFRKEQERKEKLLKREIPIESFDDFLLIQKQLLENLLKRGTDECKLANEIFNDVNALCRKDEDFAEKHRIWMNEQMAGPAPKRLSDEEKRKWALLHGTAPIETVADVKIIFSELVTSSVSPEMKSQINANIDRLRKKDPEFRKEYNEWWKKVMRDIKAEAGDGERLQGKSNNTVVPPTRGGGYTI